MHSLNPLPQDHALDLGDYIGTESCVDMKADVESCGGGGGGGGGAAGRRRRVGREREEEKKKEFPPPMPCHGVLMRYITGDGRVVIREEKPKRREYFRAHRAGGRLTLHLVCDDGVLEDDRNFVDVNKEEIEDKADNENEDRFPAALIGVGVGVGVAGGGGGGKCYNYNSVDFHLSQRKIAFCS